MDKKLKIYTNNKNDDGLIYTISSETYQPLISLSINSKINYAFIGGCYYVKNKEKFSLKNLKDISLMPYYCYARIFPQKHDKLWLHSSLYIKMPLLCIQDNNDAYGISFEPILKVDNIKLPLALVFQNEEGKIIFELGIFNDFDIYKKEHKDYIEWNTKKLKLMGKYILNLQGKKLKIRFKEYYGDDWKDIVQQYLYDLNLEREKIDIIFHFNKTINFLYSVYDKKEGIYIEWKLRNKNGFMSYYFALPIYNTLVSDLYLIYKKTNNIKIKEISEGVKRLLLNERASKLFNEGRVWHNSVSKSLKGIRFFTHLGTGLGGYPGGQATILRSFLERIKYGDNDPELIKKTKQGLKWLLNNLHEDGHWNRVYYVFEERSPFKLETGETSYSVGGNAEGAIALLLAHDVFGDKIYLDKGLLALDWVNKFIEGGVITSGYLRDNKQDETDGVSAIFAVQANLMAYKLLKEKEYLDYALDFGYYMTTWQRWWDKEYPSFDTLVFSFTPRIAPCETVWAAEAYLDLYNATNDELWLILSENAFKSINYENNYGGYSEAIYYDEKLGLHPHHFECVYTTDAVLRYLLKYISLDNKLNMRDVKIPNKQRLFSTKKLIFDRIIGQIAKNIIHKTSNICI